jgi:hypothetical protein
MTRISVSPSDAQIKVPANRDRAAARPLPKRLGDGGDDGLSFPDSALSGRLPSHRWPRRLLLDEHPVQLLEIVVIEKPADHNRWEERSGYAAITPPSPAMNSRRRICNPQVSKVAP